jgi:hypothetical protein
MVFGKTRFSCLSTCFEGRKVIPARNSRYRLQIEITINYIFVNSAKANALVFESYVACARNESE